MLGPGVAPDVTTELTTLSPLRHVASPRAVTPPLTLGMLARGIQRAGACHPTPLRRFPACCSSRLAARTLDLLLPSPNFRISATPTTLVPARIQPARAAQLRDE